MGWRPSAGPGGTTWPPGWTTAAWRATALIVLGVGVLWNPPWLDDWLGIGLGLVQMGESAVTFVAGVNPPAPLVLAALAVRVGGAMVSNWLELVD